MKKKFQTINKFDMFFGELESDNQALLKSFFSELNQYIILRKKEKNKLINDFRRAVLYFSSIGISIPEAIKRLDSKYLGGFYARPPLLWYPLDDAAKIYPLSMKHGQMAVFRLSAYLKSQVIPELLQMALTFTIKRFPSFSTTLKKGFFWHYLDTSKRRYEIEPESSFCCQPLIVSKSGSQSFRVLYHDNRISVEFFHVLTDGSGGITFIKTLLSEYLRLIGISANDGDKYGILDVNDFPHVNETVNEFLQQTATKNKSVSTGFIDKPALQFSGRLSKHKPCQIIHFKLDAKELKSAADNYSVTVTSYVLALLFLASRSATDEIDGDISIQVPVNMRKFYPSKTLRNFSLYCGIRLSPKEITDISNILPKISSQLLEKSSCESMGNMLLSTKQLVKMLRFVPLFIKAPVARLIYGFLGDKIFSNTLSNLGVIKLPEEFSEHVLAFDFVLGTIITNRAGCSLATFGNTSMLSVAKNTCDPSFEEALYSLFSSEGIHFSVEGSPLHED